MATYTVTTIDGEPVKPGQPMKMERGGPRRDWGFTFDRVAPIDWPDAVPKVTMRTGTTGTYQYRPDVFGLQVTVQPGPCTNAMCVRAECDDVSHKDGTGNVWYQPERSAWCLLHDRYCLPYCTEPDDGVGPLAELVDGEGGQWKLFLSHVADAVFEAVVAHLRAYVAPGGEPLPEDYMPVLFEPGHHSEHWSIGWEAGPDGWPHAVTMGLDETSVDFPFMLSPLKIRRVEFSPINSGALAFYPGAYGTL